MRLTAAACLSELPNRRNSSWSTTPWCAAPTRPPRSASAKRWPTPPCSTFCRCRSRTAPAAAFLLTLRHLLARADSLQECAGGHQDHQAGAAQQPLGRHAATARTPAGRTASHILWAAADAPRSSLFAPAFTQYDGQARGPRKDAVLNRALRQHQLDTARRVLALSVAELTKKVGSFPPTPATRRRLRA